MKMATKKHETKSRKRFNGLKWAENMCQNGRKDEVLKYVRRQKPTCRHFMKGVKDYTNHVEIYKNVINLGNVNG